MLIQRPSSAILCSQCTDILPLLVDISPTPKLGNAHTKWWNDTYGKIQSIQGLVPESCELCRILCKAFTRVPGFNLKDTKIMIRNRSLSKYKGLEHSACSFEAVGVQLVLAPGLPVVSTDDGERVQAFTSRPVMQLLNPLLVRYWMAKCEKIHAACKPDYSSKDFRFPFRLIDVQNGRLVEAPRDVRYVALSYVWGGVKPVMLNKTTRRFMEQEGSITSEGLKEPEEEYLHIKPIIEGRVIPRTIQDAIRLCQLLDERYLWTDSLCIMQDDEFQDSNGSWTNADKMAQIPKMNLIYGASVLTIIAAHGTDSNAGLPGVHASNTRTTQTIGKIGDQIFLSIKDDPMEDFWQSKWCERAWTFQEFLLSKRHLIFLPEQTIFHCSTLAWCEDHSLDFLESPEDVFSAPAWTKSYKLNPLHLPDRSKWPKDIFFPPIFVNQYWNQWLKTFLKRRLTVSSDILFAFDGALSASRPYLGRFHHGLPVDYFCESLHWLVGTSSMYLGHGSHEGLTQRREGFPSWSWTGWIWDVASFEEFHINFAGKTLEHWCRVGVWGTKISAHKDFELWKIASPDVEGWARLNFFPSRAFEIDADFIDSELPNHLDTIKKSPVPLNCLVMKTVIATVFVSSNRQSQYSSALQTFSSPNFIPENLVGGINFPAKWQNKIMDGLQLQVIITGSVYFGPDSKFPDQTDEKDPNIDCLVVEEVGDRQFERLTNFRARFEQLTKLEWRPIVAVLR